jgi:hypothetical protein
MQTPGNAFAQPYSAPPPPVQQPSVPIPSGIDPQQAQLLKQVILLVLRFSRLEFNPNVYHVN